MRVTVTIAKEGHPLCVYEVIVPEDKEETDAERLDHAQRVLQSAIEMGCSLMDAAFRVTGKSALPIR